MKTEKQKTNKLFWLIIIAVLLLATLVFLGLIFLNGPEVAWLCQNGGWVKIGKTNTAKPIAPCGNQKEAEEILVTTPRQNQTVNSPFIVEGKARGGWFFEASFPIDLIDEQGRILGQSYVQAQSDWMTPDFVPFKGEINYTAAATTTGKLVLKKDNPSGLPENDKKIEIPVLISPSQTIVVKVFFSNNNLDPEITCNKVFAVERRAPKTSAMARAALEQLLVGPSEQEKTQGYFTNINPGVKIKKLEIANDLAKVDFDQTLEQAVGGSCRVSAIRAEITETLKQFSTVRNVEISINGRVKDILQP